MKTIHVVAAVVWIGGVILSQVNGALAAKSGEQARMLGFIRFQAWLGKAYFAPASIVLLIAGVVMVIDSGWEFSDLWIVIGIALYALSVIIGALLLTPKSEQLTAGIEQKGMGDAGVQSLAGQLALLSRVDLLILVLVVINMVVKPGV
ncbi:MAG TPA: DUF2269 family protein [Actinomycetota bacterium]|nr:DUF2269 family protein [Actinomycetota bacterium]